MLWDIENIMPLFVPDRAPWVIVTKNSGPGARAPEAVRMMTVAAKFSGSMSVEVGLLIMNVLGVFGCLVYLCCSEIRKHLLHIKICCID